MRHNCRRAKSIVHLATRLATAEARRAALFQQGDRLIRSSRPEYPDAPACLVRYADRTLNDYRWRLSGHAKWRHLGLPDNKAAVELTGEVGGEALADLPAAARLDWLRFEARRQAMNFESAMTKGTR